MLDFVAVQLDQDDRLPGAQEIRKDADNFQVKFFDLVAGKNRVGFPLHTRLDLIERKDFRLAGGAQQRDAGDDCQRPARPRPGGTSALMPIGSGIFDWLEASILFLLYPFRPA